ncbi:MAG: division/cell wall cluster transcriptional repressor MraZ [Coriobacteriia bacterium]|nr:division/cell wall cluster transcriptional repressor MraZ [Coriobacteriia bacterium]
MTVFLGEYQHTLDAKGRVSLPSKFRSQIAGHVKVTKGLNGCLYVYTADEYESFVGKLVEGDDFNASKRELRLFFTSGTHETELDKPGRISLPGYLRDYARLDKDVVVIGNGNRIEIWDSVAWSEYNSATVSRVEDLAQELASAGLL